MLFSNIALLRHLCEIAAFIMSVTVLLSIFLSQADWISEKANTIAVMGKNSGVYLILQVRLFDTSYIEFPEKIGLKQKLHERNRNLN